MAPSDEDEAELLENLSIIRVPTFRYHYREWRYASLGDAVAQAKRDLATGRE